MLEVVRNSTTMWKVIDTDFAEPPKELRGLYTHQQLAEKDIQLFRHRILQKAKNVTTRIKEVKADG